MGQGRGNNNNNNTAPTTGPKQQLHSPRKQKKEGGGEPGPGKGGGPGRRAYGKISPFSVNPPLGLPCVPLGFFFFPPPGVFLVVLGGFPWASGSPKLGFLGFWRLASGFSPGFWLCWLLFAFPGSTQ